MAGGYFVTPGSDEQVVNQLGTDEQIWAMYQQKSPAERPAFLKAIAAKKGQAYADQLQGREAIGMSSNGVDRKVRAGALFGNNISDAQAIEDQVSQDPEDYAYDPAMEQGAGYQLPDRIEHAGAVDPLTAKLQEDAINQQRTDSTGVNAQREVLGEYASLYGQGGLSAIDRARMAQARQLRGAQNRGDQQAIMSKFEQMGRAGGNADLLARQSRLQAGQNATAMDDLETQSMALQRRDSILRDRASLGGSMQTAQDAIDSFNTLGERDRIRQNLDRENAATEATWSEGNLRDRNYTETRNEAHGVQFSADTERDQHNTGATNDARRFNVGPNQGARGMVRDRADANTDVRNARASAANHLMDVQGGKDKAEAMQEAAISGALGHVGDIVVEAAGSGSDEDEEESEDE